MRRRAFAEKVRKVIAADVAVSSIFAVLPQNAIFFLKIPKPSHWRKPVRAPPTHDSCLRHGLSDAQWSVAGPLIDWPKALAGPQETIACFSARFCGWRGPEGLGRTCRISAAGTRGNAVRQALLWQVVGRLVLVLDRPLAQRRRICAICVCASSMSDVADFEAFLATAASTSDSWRAACSAAFSRAASALERPTCPV